MNKLRINISLSPEINKQLKECAKKEHRNISNMVEVAIMKYFNEKCKIQQDQIDNEV